MSLIVYQQKALWIPFFSLDMFTVFSLYYTHYRMVENQRGEINQMNATG